MFWILWVLAGIVGMNILIFTVLMTVFLIECRKDDRR